MNLPGHEFLAHLGKTRLRPGGKEGSDFLFSHAPITPNSKVLEVACNRGQTMMEVASRFQCKIIGVDASKEVVDQANDNIHHLNLEDWCSVQVGNAMALDFPNEAFDFIINEAMLPMLNPAQRLQALAEYRRVLKPHGYLLTHDVLIDKKDDDLIKELGKTIHHTVSPDTLDTWRSTFEQAGFIIRDQKVGHLSLMNPMGLINDEGALNAVRIVKNGLKPENRDYFLSIKKFFTSHKDHFSYVALVSQKG